MNEQVRQVQQEIESLESAESQLQRARERLAYLQRQCKHSWSEAQRRTKYHEAYTIPGDPPGTMGVDWRGPTHVPAKTDEWWERVCHECGKVEKTTKTAPTAHKPVF